MNNDHLEHIPASDYHLGCNECIADVERLAKRAQDGSFDGAKLHMSYAHAWAERMIDDDKHAQHIQTDTYWTICMDCRQDLANILEGSHPATFKHVFEGGQDGDAASQE